MAQPFDPERFQLNGEPVPIVEQIGYSAATARAFFCVSNNGVLAYRGNVALNGQLTWYDRSGKELEKVGAAGDFLGFSVSGETEKPRKSPAAPTFSNSLPLRSYHVSCPFNATL